MEQIPDIEKSVFADENVSLTEFKEYLREKNLALVVGRDLTTRDDVDRQQPFNLRVAGTSTQTVTPGSSGKIYDISHLQFFQADHLRGMGGLENPRSGRRILPRVMHDQEALAHNISAPGQAGSVKLGDDGSMAAFLPAGRAMTWQTTDPQGTPRCSRARLANVSAWRSAGLCILSRRQ